MKKSALAVLAVPFLLLIGQVVSAQSDGWRVVTDVDVIDDSVTVVLAKGANPDFESSLLALSCQEQIGFPTVSVIMFEGGDSIIFPTRLVEVTYRIGTDEAVTDEWIDASSLGLGLMYSISDGPGYSSGIDATALASDMDATALVASMVQDNSRFVVRARVGGYEYTRIWNIEGLADVIDECMAVFD